MHPQLESSPSLLQQVFHGQICLQFDEEGAATISGTEDTWLAGVLRTWPVLQVRVVRQVTLARLVNLLIAPLPQLRLRGTQMPLHASSLHRCPYKRKRNNSLHSWSC